MKNTFLQIQYNTSTIDTTDVVVEGLVNLPISINDDGYVSNTVTEFTLLAANENHQSLLFHLLGLKFSDEYVQSSLDSTNGTDIGGVYKIKIGKEIYPNSVYDLDQCTIDSNGVVTYKLREFDYDSTRIRISTEIERLKVLYTERTLGGGTALETKMLNIIEAIEPLVATVENPFHILFPTEETVDNYTV